MAIQSFIIDPDAAVPLTGDEIVAKINTDTVDPITRASSVSAVARPIEALEVTNTELATEAAKDNLDAIADVDRSYVRTSPSVGEFPIIAVQRDSAGNLDVDYDDVPIA